MKRSAIETAKKMMTLRDFEGAIKILQSRAEMYEDSFDYYCTLGIACLYSGDAGLASYNFEFARKIKMNDTRLLLGQAAIFLRRGDTERAIQYYLDVLDIDPQCEVAKKAMDFLREIHGDYETICRWVDSGKIEQFYPPLGVNPKKVGVFVLSAFLGIIVGILAVNIALNVHARRNIFSDSSRASLTELQLTVEEERNPQDESEKTALYILSEKEIKNAYETAGMSFNQYNDNRAQIEINRLLNSNASGSIKQKASLLMSYLQEPTFDSLVENYTIDQVKAEPKLYLDCFVDWAGRIANEQKNDNSVSFTLLVGYEDQKNVQGAVTVEIPFIPVPELDGTKPIRVLGKVSLDGDRIYLQGKSVYQNIDN